MSIYTAKTIVNYRGFLIRIRVTLSRDDSKGLKRQVHSKVRGYLIDVFEETRVDDEIDTITLNGNTVKYIPHAYTDLYAREMHTTYLEKHMNNWEKRYPSGHTFSDLFRMLYAAVRSHPKPTPLSKQIEQTLEYVQHRVDQFIEDRYMDFDESELQYGLANTLSEPVDDVSVDTQTPTNEYTDEIASPEHLAENLEPEQEVS